MAILMQEEKGPLNWFAIIVVLFAVGAIASGVYYLFFAPTPGIEVVIPAPLQSAGKISGIAIDPSAVINSQNFRALRVYTGLPSVGQIGRPNPFLPF